MALIKSEVKVSSNLEADNFLQRIINLLGCYSTVNVSIKTESGFVVLEELEVKDSFAFDDVDSIFNQAISPFDYICMIEVV